MNSSPDGKRPLRGVSKILPLTLLGLALTACGTQVEYTPLRSAASLAPRSSESVEVFLTKRPAQPYVEVGMLEARQESTFSNDQQSEIVAELREDAGKIGCHGIVVLGGADEVSGHVYDGHGSTQTLKGYRAVCIVFEN